MTGCSDMSISWSRQNLPLIKEEFKTENNLIKDVSQSVAAGRAKYWQSSTADVTLFWLKGIIAILIRVFSNQSPTDIIAADMAFYWPNRT
jgi:cysteine desulfuration protein SufE